LPKRQSNLAVKITKFANNSNIYYFFEGFLLQLAKANLSYGPSLSHSNKKVAKKWQSIEEQLNSMIWGSNKKLDAKRVLISLNNSEVRLFLLENKAGELTTISSQAAEYSTSEQLESICTEWLTPLKAKGLSCDWLLSRSLYKTISVSPPKVPESELKQTIKWLVKDQIEESLDTVLVTYYKPFAVEREAQKLVAVTIDKEFTESLINISSNLNLNLNSIQIDELSPVNALSGLQDDQQISGLIDEDHQGLIFNFYVGRSLAFTRHIRGRFFPNQSQNSFSLDAENNEEQSDRFLLETQRTLDYCISQFFRSPVNRLTLNDNKVRDNNLVESLEQITELPVDRVELNQQYIDEQESASLALTIAEAGAALGGLGNSPQWVDFYMPEYRPQPLEFGFKYAVGLGAIAVLGLIGYGLLQNSELTQQQQRLAESKQLLQQTQTALQALSQRLGVASKTEDLDKTIERKQAELLASRKLLNKVEKTSPVKPVLYSQVLSALAQQKAQALWLTQIKLSPKGIDLAGQTTNPESIPTYIDQMSNNVILASHFENLSIERSKKNKRLVLFQMTNGRYSNAY
jgi:MSHA biogenesis protein MshI